MSNPIPLRDYLERLKKEKAEEKGLEPQEVQVRERVHIEKFDGGKADIAAGMKPSEYIVIEGGKGIVHMEVDGVTINKEEG